MRRENIITWREETGSTVSEFTTHWLNLDTIVDARQTKGDRLANRITVTLKNGSVREIISKGAVIDITHWLYHNRYARASGGYEDRSGQ